MQQYPLPIIADFTAQIAGSTVFSRLDLQKGYYQIPMASEDIAKTAIITPFGTFEFLRLPFGLRNAGNTFQRMMDQILEPPRRPGPVQSPRPDDWPGEM